MNLRDSTPGKATRQAVPAGSARRRFADFQLVQQMLADSVIEINSARLMVLHAAWTIDQGLDARDWISMVKVQAAEMLGRVTDRAVQVFGGMGYCKETLLPRRPDLPDFRRHI